MAAGRLDPLLERGDADGAENHFVAQDIAWGSVDADGAREEPCVLTERSADLIARGILLEPSHVEALVFGRGKRLRFGRRPGVAEQFSMESEDIFDPSGSCMRTAIATRAASAEPGPRIGSSLSTIFKFGSSLISVSMSGKARLQKPRL